MIKLEDVTKVYPGGVEAVRDVSFEVAEEETFVLVGVSGSGKTTTLKMINRLVEPTSGTITLDGDDIMGKSPEELRRGIGYVIQEIALFPHMTIADNITVVLRLLGVSGNERRERARELLELVDMPPDEFLDRYPSELSGGQQQRVGVARGLAADPPVMLMDEPFGALDPITREQLQMEFLQLEEHIRKTIVMVTHDIFEAVLLGDRLGVMAEAQLMQVATPEELIDQPANEFVEQFLGQHRLQLRLTSMTAEDCAASQGAADRRIIPADATVSRAREHLEEQSIEVAVTLEDGGRTAGVVRRRDLAATDDHDAPAASLVDDDVPALHRTDNVLEILRVFTKHGVDTVPVVDDHDSVTAIVTRTSASQSVNEALGLKTYREQAE